jgi:DNA-binding MarR family transcriptional regulator
MTLRNAYFAMHRNSDAEFAKYGVTANQFVLLSLLAENGGVTQRDLVTRASSDPNTIRQMLDVLRRKGLVQRARHPRDARAWQISLTGRGKTLFEKLWRHSRALRKRFVNRLGGKEAEKLICRLEVLIQSL